MKRILLTLLLIALTMPVFAEISDIEQSGSWIYLYNEQGKKYKTLSASSVGTIVGWSSKFFVSVSGSWVYLYDADGKRYKTLSKSSVGDIIAVSGTTFTSRSGSWVYTYDMQGKRINTRSAH